MAARGRSGLRGAGRGGHAGSGRVPAPVPGRRARAGRVRPGDDGRAAAVRLLPGRAVRPLPQTGKILAEAAAADDARDGGSPQPATPRALARRAERRERLARARDRLAAGDTARREAQRTEQEAWDKAAAAGKRRGAAVLAMSRAPAGAAPGRGPASPTRTCGDAQPERLRGRLQ